MRLRTKILLAILLTVLAGDVLGTLVVQNRFASGAQRETANQAQARAQQVQSLYTERATTLEKEGEAISLYPAVIAALVGNNPAPLSTWAAQVANLQGTSVTVTDANGTVVARGHAPDQTGDDLSGQLVGLRLALQGTPSSGTEAGDELGLALRGYVPVLQGGLSGPIVGAVMIADPLDARFFNRLAGGDAASLNMRVESAGPPAPTRCAAPIGVSASCSVPLTASDGSPTGNLSFEVPLAAIERAQADAQAGLWLASAVVLVLGAAAAWLLARSLTRPLAHLTTAAQRISAGDFVQLQPAQVQSRDEIGTLSGAFETMRGRVAEMTDRIRNERDVLDAVLDSTGDGIVMVDRYGGPVVANRAWTKLVGGDRLAAANDLRRADGDAGDFAEAAERWLADAEQVAAADFERFDPYQRMRAYSAPVRYHGGGAILGRIFVLRDVTRETEAERMRSALIATVSHELRSPLTAITGYADTLLHDGPWAAATQREFLEVIALSAARLAALVDNLLDAATLEAGALRLQCEPVRVERIAERVLAQRRLLAGTCTLHLETRPGLPLADADPLRVEQVLANLVDNAIKYSPGGGAIHVRVSSTHLSGNEVSISVSDHGLGIPPESQEHLFERFYRVEGSGRAVKGVGLGLYICRSLVESHGGRIWVESQPGAGSTFVFTLPKVGDTPPEWPPPEASLASPQPVRGTSG